MDLQCWYCGKPAVAVWHTTWDREGEEWPMCQGCDSKVRAALKARQANAAEADELDHVSGIDTRGLAGEWIPPEAMARTGTLQQPKI
jgi:hypothetical protein